MAAGDAGAQAAALRERGQALLDLGRPQEALGVLAGALRLDPDAVEGYALLALALRRLDRAAESLQTIEAGLAHQPNVEWLHRLRSQAYAAGGDLQVALAAAQEAHRLQPDAWQAKHQLIDVLLELARNADAERVARELVELAPTESASFNQLGRVALAQNRLLEAEHRFRQALQLDPGVAVYHDNVGITLYHQGRVAAATRFFDSAIGIDPSRRSIQSNLYGSSRELRRHSLVFSPRRMLERISPRTYRYFLSREGATLRMYAAAYFVRIGLPLLLGALLAAFVYERRAGAGAGVGIVLAGVGLAALGFVLACVLRRVGNACRWLEPGEREVAFHTQALPILFSPLWLLLAGGLGLWRGGDGWELWLVVLVVGIVLVGRVLARQGRGWAYAAGARAYPRWCRTHDRFRRWTAGSRVGAAVGVGLAAVRHPATWLAVCLAGFAFTPDDGLRGIWGVPALLFAVFTLLRLLDALRARFARRRGDAPA